jgi:hypothetical protein
VVIEVGTQVCDHVMGQPLEMDELIQEVKYSVGLWASDRLDFDPVGELVDGHQYSVESSWRSWKRPNHVEPPAGKGPSWWYGE